MIRVIIERKLKKGADIGRLLLKLRIAAMPHKGYISSETLVGAEDKSLVTVISTWNRLEDWKAWEATETRARLNKEIEPLIAGKPVIKIYEILSTEEQEYLEDPYAWLQKMERPHFQG